MKPQTRLFCGFTGLPVVSLQPLHGVVLVVTLILMVAGVRAQGTDQGILGTLGIMWKWTPLLAQGFLLNLTMSALAMIGGSAIGVLLGLAQVSLLRPVRKGSWLITQTLRNAPWLVAIFYVMYLLPYEIHVAGRLIPIPDWVKATCGFALPVIANVSEIVRGGIQSIPAPQWESARSLAFTRRQTLWMIIIPQCAKRMLPPWMNLYAILTMATVLANIVGVSEALTMTRDILASERRTDLLLPMYGYILIWFFVYIYPISRLTAWLERRWAVRG